MKRPKQIATKHIDQHLREINSLSDTVARLLHINRDVHTLWVSVSKNKLTLMTDDSTFATQLHYQQNIICQHINQQLLTTLKGVKIKLIPPTKEVREASRERCYQISSQTANVLSQIADTIEDEGIRETLKRLGK